MATQYLTAKDIAAELGVSLSTAYVIARQCHRVLAGRAIRVSRAAFDAWKREHEAAPSDTPWQATPAARVTPSSSAPRGRNVGGRSSQTQRAAAPSGSRQGMLMIEPHMLGTSTESDGQ